MKPQVKLSPAQVQALVGRVLSKQPAQIQSQRQALPQAQMQAQQMAQGGGMGMPQGMPSMVPPAPLPDLDRKFNNISKGVGGALWGSMLGEGEDPRAKFHEYMSKMTNGEDVDEDIAGFLNDVDSFEDPEDAIDPMSWGR